MANASDIAAYILSKTGEITAMKLQKLLYYSQAWSLVWDQKPIFPEPIEAWAGGPVIPKIYQKHRGEFNVLEWPSGDQGNLTPAECETVDEVVRFYGDKTAQNLSDLTHREEPWKIAREGMDDMERGNREITHASMDEYYSGIREKEG